MSASPSLSRLIASHCSRPFFAFLASTFFFQAKAGMRYWSVSGVQTCALPIFGRRGQRSPGAERAPAAPEHAGRLDRPDQIGRASCREIELTPADPGAFFVNMAFTDMGPVVLLVTWVPAVAQGLTLDSDRATMR